MAATPVFNDPDGVLRSISNVPPAHYTIKLQSFSLLMKNSIDRYASNQFEAGGYKWNLVIYPNGNKSRNNISLSTWQWPKRIPSKPVGKFMPFSDVEGKERRFHRMKLEWGFDQFISLKVLNDSANGFLVDDTCVLGAEVFVCKERSTGKGECLQMIKDPITYKHTFRVDNYSKLGVVCSESEEFNAADLKWKIRLYPKGKGDGLGTHLSLYLALVDSTTLPPGSKIYAEFTLRILNQINTNNYYGKASHWFSTRNEEYGWSRHITSAYFRTTSGYLVKDTSIFEADVTVHGVVKPL
ncbi:Ubiquitin carboxyl-terminal hydrolase 12 [Morus notabilis]|uniref:Ubiquitin carboxyl-terminal hydrolase 12 n=1 Tax=Morus notabilis TaxID=981085 RepID=W9RIX7_9ROSA|nr:uncharacterized protein LOC21407846 [Morus notabilis]EXB80281.1 Ubiquitin carboxyl-terminal hydrolase 12 [Morus notabilis]